MYLAKVRENLINIDLDKILYIPHPKQIPRQILKRWQRTSVMHSGTQFVPSFPSVTLIWSPIAAFLWFDWFKDGDRVFSIMIPFQLGGEWWMKISILRVNFPLNLESDISPRDFYLDDLGQYFILYLTLAAADVGQLSLPSVI